jgi:hypothetical protein
VSRVGALRSKGKVVAVMMARDMAAGGNSDKTG